MCVGVRPVPAELEGFFFCGSASTCRNREFELLTLVCWETFYLLRCLVTVVPGLLAARGPSTSSVREDISTPSGAGLGSGAAVAASLLLPGFFSAAAQDVASAAGGWAAVSAATVMGAVTNFCGNKKVWGNEELLRCS